MSWTNIDPAGGGGGIVAPYLNFVRTQDATNNITLVGTADNELWPPIAAQPITGGTYNGYRKVGHFDVNKNVGGYSLVDGIDETGAALTACDIILPITGTYEIEGFATFQHPTNNSTLAFTFGAEIGGNYVWSPRPVKHDMPNLDGHANLSGKGLLTLPAGTPISLWCATDRSGTVEIDTVGITVEFKPGI